MNTALAINILPPGCGWRSAPSSWLRSVSWSACTFGTVVQCFPLPIYSRSIHPCPAPISPCYLKVDQEKCIKCFLSTVTLYLPHFLDALEE